MTGQGLNLSLVDARSFVEKVRYSGDLKKDTIDLPDNIYSEIINNLYQNNLLVSKELTPYVYQVISEVCKDLKIPNNSIESFVYPSSDIQASCLSVSKEKAVLRFSSSLINLLDKDELKFIAGHELGHFLLGHGREVDHSENRDSSDVYLLMKSRYKEISADRVGLVACRSTEKAISAIFKLISGLKSEHIRFDIAAFISQKSNQENYYSSQNIFSTHPSNLLRCRALLWFSLTDFVTKNEKHFNEDEMTVLDRRIDDDLVEFIDGPIFKRLDDVKHKIKVWLAAEKIAEDGVFDKDEQESFLRIFGQETMNNMTGFLRTLNKNEIKKTLDGKIQANINELKHFFPNSFQEVLDEIVKEVDCEFAS